MRLAVFASGGGSNLEAIFEAIQDGRLKAEVALVISNKETAGALERAARWNTPSLVLNPSSFDDEGAYVAAVIQAFSDQEVNFIALAGYLKKIPEALVRLTSGRMLNIHPALLPAFGGPGMYGRRIHEAVLKRGARWTGVTIHLVDEDYDAGPIVLQQPVPVEQDDTPETLAARVLKTEHKLYPEALNLFATGQVAVEGHSVRLLNTPTF